MTRRSGKSDEQRREIAERVAAGDTVAAVSQHGAIIRSPTRTTCARCSWPLKVEGLSDEDADRVEALHRQRCPGPVCDRDSVLHEREPGGGLYFGGIKVTSGPMVSGRNRKLSKEGQETYDRLRAECGRVRPDGFTQSDVDAAKAVLLSKVERKR